jgi:Rhodopirellula transposase DDE domain
MDNGPASRGVRPQLLQRMVQLADHIGQPMPFLSSPPSHRKYHSLERCWGMVEVHGHGTKVVAVETRLAWAKRMTWQRLHPVVALRHKGYQKAITLGKKAMQEVESRLERHPAFPKWDMLSRPVAAL